MVRCPGPRDSYYHQKYTATKVRGIEFLLTFEEWWQIWSDSGHWHERGRGRGKYCMARHGDTGPYATWNVSIMPYVINSRDGKKKQEADQALVLRMNLKRSLTLKGRPLSMETRAKMSAVAMGRPVSEEARRKISETKRRQFQERGS